LAMFEYPEGLMEEFAHHGSDHGHFGFAAFQQSSGKLPQNGIVVHRHHGWQIQRFA
jgi:hypothetical protein